MNTTSMQTLLVLALVGLIIFSTTEIAVGRGMGNGAGDGTDTGPRAGMGRVYGEIIAIDGDVLTIRPEVPQELLDRMAERGIEREFDLPDEVKVTIDTETTCMYAGEKATAGDFKVGDVVVAFGAKGDGDDFTARRLADAETAKKFIKERMGNRGGGMGNRGGGMGNRGGGMGQGFGDGTGMGPGRGNNAAPGIGGMGRHAYGEIISLSADSITIRTEIPEKLAERIANCPDCALNNIPEEVTLSFADTVKYAKGGEFVDEMPFTVGDTVVIRADGVIADGDCQIVGISDPDSIKAWMKKRGGDRGNRGGRGAGRGNQS